jgi:hypothetical protein
MLQDYRTAVCPFIDVVDYNNMEYRAQDEGARGAFDWQLYYKRQVPLGFHLKEAVFLFSYLLIRLYWYPRGMTNRL